MESIYARYAALAVDKELFSLEPGEITQPWFCYPVNARPIGFEGCILYCFLPEYGDMVFACNPESCAQRNVYPLAESFGDFLRLILACGTANPVEQIVWMSREQFHAHMASEAENEPPQRKAALKLLEEELGLSPMDDPFAYVKAVQKDFDDSRVQYSDEYYDVTGIENPRGTQPREEPVLEFAPVTFAFYKKDGGK